MTTDSVSRAPDADDGSSTESEYYDEVDYDALETHAAPPAAALMQPQTLAANAAVKDARLREDSRHSDVSATGGQCAEVISDIQAPALDPTMHRTDKDEQREGSHPAAHDSSLARKERPGVVTPRSQVSPSPERAYRYSYSRRSAERSRSQYSDASRHSRSRSSAPKHYEERSQLVSCSHCDARVTLPGYATAYHRATSFCHCCKLTFGNTKRDIIHPDYALVQLRFCYACFQKNGSTFIKKVMTMKPLTQLECSGCHQVKAMERFHRRQRVFRPWETRLGQKNYCSRCSPSGVAPADDKPKYEEYKCGECFKTQDRDSFSKSTHDLGNSANKSDRLVCDECKSKTQESELLCVKCSYWLPRYKFSEGHQKVAREQDLKIGFKFKPSYMCLTCTAIARKEREEERSRSVSFKRKREEFDDHHESRRPGKFHFNQDPQNERYNEIETRQPNPMVHSTPRVHQDEFHFQERRQNLHDDRSVSRSRDDSLQSVSLSRAAASQFVRDNRSYSQPRLDPTQFIHARPRIEASRSVYVDRSYSHQRDDSNQPERADPVTSRPRVEPSRSAHIVRSYSRPRVEPSKSVHVDRTYSRPRIYASQSVHVERTHSYQRAELSHAHSDRPILHPTDPRQFAQVEQSHSRLKDPRLAAVNRSFPSPNTDSRINQSGPVHVGAQPPPQDPRLAYANRSFLSPKIHSTINSSESAHVDASQLRPHDPRLARVNRSFSTPKIVSKGDPTGSAQVAHSRPRPEDPRLTYVKRSFSIPDFDSIEPDDVDLFHSGSNDLQPAYVNRSFARPNIDANVSTVAGFSHLRPRDPRLASVDHSSSRPILFSNQPVRDGRVFSHPIDNRVTSGGLQGQIHANGVRKESEFNLHPQQQIPDDALSYRRSTAYFDQLERERKQLASLMQPNHSS